MGQTLSDRLLSPETTSQKCFRHDHSGREVPCRQEYVGNRSLHPARFFSHHDELLDELLLLVVEECSARSIVGTSVEAFSQPV